ncbi:MAG TPA: hypothetical protein VEJ18_13305 [Planctomycetota bacterium]|nr:hypothetical protein [Planctomycetota bacterium]
MTPVQCACGKTILIKPEWQGLAVRCAGCRRTVDPAAPAQAVSDRRPCPFCGEAILQSARKCRFCRRALDGSSPEAAVSKPHVDPGGTGVLVVGILAWVFWMPGFFLFPIVWAWGHAYVRDCRAKGVLPSGAGQAGRILGMIGTVVAAIGLLCLGLFLFLLFSGQIK